MKLKKKILTLGFVAITLALTGCGASIDNNNKSNSNEEKKVRIYKGTEDITDFVTLKTNEEYKGRLVKFDTVPHFLTVAEPITEFCGGESNSPIAMFKDYEELEEASSKLGTFFRKANMTIKYGNEDITDLVVNTGTDQHEYGSEFSSSVFDGLKNIKELKSLYPNNVVDKPITIINGNHLIKRTFNFSITDPKTKKEIIMKEILFGIEKEYIHIPEIAKKDLYFSTSGSLLFKPYKNKDLIPDGSDGTFLGVKKETVCIR